MVFWPMLLFGKMFGESGAPLLASFARSGDSSRGQIAMVGEGIRREGLSTPSPGKRARSKLLHNLSMRASNPRRDDAAKSIFAS